MYRKPSRANGYLIYPYQSLRCLVVKMREQRGRCLSRLKAGSSAMRKAPIMQRLRFVARLDAARWV